MLSLSSSGKNTLEYFDFKNYSNHKVDAMFKEFLWYKKTETDKIKNFSGSIKDLAWVKNKLQVLVNIDQKARFLWLHYEKIKPKFSKLADRVYFKRITLKKLLIDIDIDIEHGIELKKLLNKYNWFVISKFGTEADCNGWLLVQHQDRDIQKMVLKRLDKLLRIGETSKSNYAYLYDRVAVGENKPQKYGTQGVCVGVGLWEPSPIEDIKRIDELRKDMGLMPLSEYKKGFKDFCFGAS